MFNAVQDMFLFDGRSHIDPVRFGFAASNAVAAVDSVYVPVYGNSESLSWGKWQRPSTNADAYNTALWDAPSPVGSKVATPKALRLDGDGNVWMI